jgi:hypothetical protein
LKLTKVLKNFRFVTQEINPSKFTVIIDKTHIILVSSNRSWCRTPYIQKNKFERFIWNTTRLRVRELMALVLLTRITNHVIIWFRNKWEIVLAEDLLNDD